MAQNQTLGRGKLYLSAALGAAMIYVGNTPSFGLTLEESSLPHYNADEGIRKKDIDIPLEVNRMASFITDNISPENLANALLGTKQTVTQSAVTSDTYDLTGITAGATYQLGQSATAPAGHRNISASGFSVAVAGGGASLVAGTDYTVDLEKGLISFIEGSAVAVEGEDIEVTYAVTASTWTRVISGDTAFEGVMTFVQDNPRGDNHTWVFPSVRLKPNGEYQLKGDEWQQISFETEILDPVGTLEAVYVDGMPVAS